MQIDPTSWHYRLYVFNYQLCQAWLGKDFYYQEPDSERIGLCPYIRTILIWGPLVMATYLIPFGALAGVFFYMPYITAGWAAIPLTFLGFAAAIGLIFGFFYIIYQLHERGERRKAAKREDELHRLANNLPEPETFFSVLKEYVMSIKTKVCPVMEVQHKGKTDV